LSGVSSLTVAGARMLVGSVILLPIALYRGASFTIVAHLTPTQWLWTITAVVLLFGYVLTWYSALKLANATYVATILVPATLVTNTLTAIFINHSFDARMVLSSILFVAGGAIVILFAKNFSPVSDGPKEPCVNT